MFVQLADSTVRHPEGIVENIYVRISHAERFPKTLFALSQCRTTRAKGSGDLLSHSPVHADARDEEGYSGGAVAREGKTLARIGIFGGG